LITCGAALALAACARTPTLPPPSPTLEPRSAAVSEVVQMVEARAASEQAYTSVAVGYVLGAGGAVRTGLASRARLDLSDGTLLRLGQNSAFVLQDVAPSDDGLLARVKLEAGKIWVSLTGGALEVETPVGVASVRGSFAVFQYGPGDPDDPDDDLLLVDCLEGSCAAANENTHEQLGNLERVVLGRFGHLRAPLTLADLQAFLQENPESAGLLATLTAAPPATRTPAPPTATASATLTASASPAIATPTFTFTPVPTATPLPTVAPPADLLPPFVILGQHVVREQETIFCIARAYGVTPNAIAQANGLSLTSGLSPGQTVRIPAVQWTNIAPGPVCPAQFTSPFPALPTATFTPLPSATATNTSAPPPPATEGPTPTLDLPPTEEPEMPTATLIPPDFTGPAISNLSASPVTVDAFTTCVVTFKADISDASGVASATVEWASFESGAGQGLSILNSSPVAAGSEPMTFVSLTGLTYLTQFEVTIPFGGHLEWKVAAVDTANNSSESPPGPIIQTSESSCPGQIE
jgi:LysM repeat protein